MTQGRRAADRRRERAGDGDGNDELDPGTTPGQAPVVPHDDYVEVDDDSRMQGAPLLSADDSAEGLPEASAVMMRERSTSAGRPRQTTGVPRDAAPVRGHVVDDEVMDAEKSFAREFKRRPARNNPDTRALKRPESTEVKELRPPKRPRPGGVFVVVTVDGQTLQQPVTFAIPVTPALLGRSTSADVQVDESSVSLRHAEVAWDKETATFTIADLGSTSGTLRNGLVVEGRAPLQHGDIVAVGKVELRFLKAETAPVDKVPEPAQDAPADVVVESTERLPERTSPAARAARDAANKVELEALQARRARVRQRALLVIGASALALLSVGAITLAYREAFSDSAPAQIRHQVSLLLGEARRLVQTGEVDAAATRVATVLGLDPHNAEATSLDRVVMTEKASRDALQLALRLGDEDRDDEALAALTRIADTSVFAKDRDRLNQALAGRALVRSLRIVENLLDQGRVEEALARAEAHLKRYPNDEGGQRLLARVKDAQRSAPKNPGLMPARAAFADGRLDEARQIATDAGFAGYAADVERFERTLAEGKAALARFDGAAARGPLDEAFRLLGSLGASSSSPTFKTVQKPYADALYLTGTERLEQGDGCGAARHLFKAARVLPGDARLEAELQRLASLAEQGLQKARGAKAQDPERAAALARDHLCFATSGSPTWAELSGLAR